MKLIIISKPFLSLIVTILMMNFNINVTFANSVSIPSLNNPNMNKVSNRIYALIGDMDIPNEDNDGFISNMVFIITNKSVIVIDPGGSLQIGRMVIEQIQAITDKPITHVINSHHHADHWMGNHAFSNLPSKPRIIGHEIMYDTAVEIGERWIKIISNLTKGKNQGTELVFPNKIISGKEKLVIDGLELQLIHPNHAHTLGDIAIYLPQEKVLIAGDILFHLRTPGFQDASPLGNLKVLSEFLALDFVKVIPGHGSVTDKTGIEGMIDYVELLHSEVKKYFEEGLSDFEMKEKFNVKNWGPY